MDKLILATSVNLSEDTPTNVMKNIQGKPEPNPIHTPNISANRTCVNAHSPADAANVSLPFLM